MDSDWLDRGVLAANWHFIRARIMRLGMCDWRIDWEDTVTDVSGIHAVELGAARPERSASVCGAG